MALKTTKPMSPQIGITLVVNSTLLLHLGLKHHVVVAKLIQNWPNFQSETDINC